MSIDELLDLIELRPTMYLGERSIFCLKAFLDGWMFDCESNDPTEFMNGFQKWIQDRFGITTTQSWAQIIVFYAPDQVAALDEAFSLFREYRSKRDIGWRGGPG